MRPPVSRGGFQVGACDGDFAGGMAQWFAQDNVHAVMVEPNPTAFEDLQRNLRGFRRTVPPSPATHLAVIKGWRRTAY